MHLVYDINEGIHATCKQFQLVTAFQQYKLSPYGNMTMNKKALKLRKA
jgi:hypothetical protein